MPRSLTFPYHLLLQNTVLCTLHLIVVLPHFKDKQTVTLFGK